VWNKFFLAIIFWFLSTWTISKLHSQVWIVHTYQDTQLIHIDTTHFIDISQIYTACNDSIKQWHAQGYLLASIDSISQQEPYIYIYTHLGSIYKWAELNLSQLPEDLQAILSQQWGSAQQRIFSTEDLALFYNIIYDYAEKKQYPFAEVKFSDVEIIEQKIKATAILDLGSKPTIDSIAVHYNNYLSDKFIKNHLGLYAGMPHDIETFKKINKKVNALPFVKLAQPWDINFGIEQNVFNLYLAERKANQANAIIGLQPTPEGSDKRYTLTADLLFKVYNTFGFGEMFHITYQQIQNASPKFYSAIQWPYLMNSRWGVNASFELTKYDTLFRKTNAYIGTSYMKDENNTFSISYQIESNRIIHFDTAFVRRYKKLPQQIDVKKLGLGLSFQYLRLDDMYMPQKGFSTVLSVSGLKKTIPINNAIDYLNDSDTFNYSQLYEELNQDQWQLILKHEIDYYLTAFKILTLKTSLNSGYISGKEQVFQNEMFMLGGYKLLRGFNELSLFTSHYHVLTFEPRIYIGENSHVHAFTDWAYMNYYHADNSIQYKWMKSFGVGAQLNTNSGLFNIAFALGQDGAQPFPKLKDTRVHIGYSIYF